MPQMVRDDSIGAALGALAGSMFPNPKSQAEAMFMREKILSSQAERAQNELKTQELRGQMDAQNGLISQYQQLLNAQAQSVPAFVEPPLPSPDFNGPMQPVPNPQRVGLDQRLAFANAAATNAIRRGGDPKNATEAIYQNVGLGGILAGGLPTTEGGMRQAQTFIKASVPDANTPFTDTQRQVLNAEKSATEASTKTVTASPTQNTILGPAIAQAMGVKPDPATGQYILPPTQNDPYRGDSMDAQHQNFVLNYNQKKAAGQATTPEQDRQYDVAYNSLYGPKLDVRPGPDGNTLSVWVYPSVPAGLIAPGGGAAGTAAPAAAGAPVSGAVSGGTAPTSGTTPEATGVPNTVAPVSAPPATMQGPVSAPSARPPQGPQPGPTPIVNTLTPPKNETNTSDAQKKIQYLNTMRETYQNMVTLLDGGFRPSVMGEVLGPNARPGGGSMRNQIQTTGMNVAQGMFYPQDQDYQTSSTAFLNAVLRDESGAAVPESEYPRYIAALIPSAGDTEKNVATKRALMENAMQARLAGLTLKEVHNMILPGKPLIVQDPNSGKIVPNNPTAPAAAAAKAPAPGAPNFDEIDALVGFKRK